jgi:hypothetical protein
MASSIREQILDRLRVALIGNTPAGANVFRSREVSITKAQTPAVVIMPQNNPLNRVATMADRNQLEVAIEIFTRGDAWDSLADPVDVATQAVIMNDQTIASLASQVRRIGENFASQEADRTAGTLTVLYQFIYLTHPADISRVGF